MLQPSIFYGLSNAKTSAKEPMPAKRTQLTQLGGLDLLNATGRRVSAFGNIFAGTLCAKAKGDPLSTCDSQSYEPEPQLHPAARLFTIISFGTAKSICESFEL